MIKHSVKGLNKRPFWNLGGTLDEMNPPSEVPEGNVIECENWKVHRDGRSRIKRLGYTQILPTGSTDPVREIQTYTDPNGFRRVLVLGDKKIYVQRDIIAWNRTYLETGGAWSFTPHYFLYEWPIGTILKQDIIDNYHVHIVASTDGTIFTELFNFPVTNSGGNCQAIANFNNKIWITRNRDSSVITGQGMVISWDGTTIVNHQQTSILTQGAGLVVFDGRLWLLGAGCPTSPPSYWEARNYNGSSWSTITNYDGAASIPMNAWSLYNLDSYYAHRNGKIFVFNNELYISCTVYNTTLAAWTFQVWKFNRNLYDRFNKIYDSATDNETYGLSGVIEWEGKIWILGSKLKAPNTDGRPDGNQQRIYSSPDCLTWEVEVASAAMGYPMAEIIFETRLYICAVNQTAPGNVRIWRYDKLKKSFIQEQEITTNPTVGGSQGGAFLNFAGNLFMAKYMEVHKRTTNTNEWVEIYSQNDAVGEPIYSGNMNGQEFIIGYDSNMIVDSDQVLGLGFQPPKIAPIVAVGAAGKISGGKYKFVYTFFRKGNYPCESNPSPESAEIYIPPLGSGLGSMPYDAGETAVPTIGALLTGDSSGATGKVISVTITGGTFGAGNAVGVVTLGECLGRFHDNEAVRYKGGDLTVNTPVAGAGVDKAKNGEFQTATTGWTATNCTIASVPGGKNGNCCEVTRVGAAPNLVNQHVTLVKGKRYGFSIWAKAGTSGEEDFYAGVYDLSSGAIMGRIIEAEVSSEFIHYTIAFTATDTDGDIRFAKNTATAGTMLFGEVALYQLSEGYKLELTGIEISTDPRINCRRIYRTTADGGIEYWDEDIDDNTTATNSCNIEDSGLGDEVSYDNFPPPQGKYYEVWDNRLWIFGNAKFLNLGFFTNTNESETWNADNFLSFLARENDVVNGGKAFQDKLHVFKQKRWFLVEKVGDSLYEVTQKSKDIGLRASASLTVCGDVMCWLSEHGIEVYNGSSNLKPHPSILVQRTIDSINADQINKVIGGHNAKEGEYWLSVPTGVNTEPDTTIVYNYNTNNMTIYKFAKYITSISRPGLIEEGMVLLTGTSDGALLTMETGYKDGTALISAKFKTGWFYIAGENEIWNILRRMFIKYILPTGKTITMNIYRNFRKTAVATISLAGNTPTTIPDLRGEIMKRINLGIRGYYVMFEFINNEDAAGECRMIGWDGYFKKRLWKKTVKAD